MWAGAVRNYNHGNIKKVFIPTIKESKKNDKVDRQSKP